MLTTERWLLNAGCPMPFRLRRLVALQGRMLGTYSAPYVAFDSDHAFAYDSGHRLPFAGARRAHATSAQ